MKWKNGYVIGRITGAVPNVLTAAPCIVFLSAGHFSCHQVRPGSAEAGSFNAFMYVQGDIIFCCKLYYFLMMTNHMLSVMPFIIPVAILIRPENLLSVANISHFNGSNSQLIIELECFFHLSLVVFHRSGCFVITHQSYSIIERIFDNLLKVKIIHWPGEIKHYTIGKPVSIPARIPSFNQNVIESVLCCKIDIL